MNASAQKVYDEVRRTLPVQLAPFFVGIDGARLSLDTPYLNSDGKTTAVAVRFSVLIEEQGKPAARIPVDVLRVEAYEDGAYLPVNLGAVRVVVAPPAGPARRSFVIEKPVPLDASKRQIIVVHLKVGDDQITLRSESCPVYRTCTNKTLEGSDKIHRRWLTFQSLRMKNEADSLRRAAETERRAAKQAFKKALDAVEQFLLETSEGAIPGSLDRLAAGLAALEGRNREAAQLLAIEPALFDIALPEGATDGERAAHARIRSVLNLDERC